MFVYLDASGNPVTQSVVSVTDANGNPVTGNLIYTSKAVIILFSWTFYLFPYLITYQQSIRYEKLCLQSYNYVIEFHLYMFYVSRFQWKSSNTTSCRSYRL